MGSQYQLLRQEQEAYDHIGEFNYECSSCTTTDDLRGIVLGQIKSLPDLNSWSAHANDIQIKVYQVVRSQDLSKPPLTVCLVVLKAALERLEEGYDVDTEDRLSSW
jgi:hypothetical protein